jgi:uncharacterized protein
MSLEKNTVLKKDTVQYQSQLAQAALTGRKFSIPGVSIERQELYYGLVSNVIEDTLQRAYPLAYQLLSNHSFEKSNAWNFLIMEYKNSNFLTSPELWRMPEGLLRFVRDKDFSSLLNLPFLSDLLEFEFKEIEVYMMPNIVAVAHKAEKFSEQDTLLLNPHFQLLNLSFPVFKTIVPSELIESQGDYYLILFRHPKTLNVEFLELSPLFAKLILELRTYPLSMKDLLEKAQEMISCNKIDTTNDYTFKEYLETQVIDFFSTLLNKGLLLGYIGENNEISN